MKKKNLYTVTLASLSHTVEASSAQNACRKVFAFWIRNKDIPKQPRTSDDGGFEGVEVECLAS